MALPPVAFSYEIPLYYHEINERPVIRNGPIVAVPKSLIDQNHTMTNHDEGNEPPWDFGGAFAMANGSSLLLSDSIIGDNQAENQAGAIDFKGGMFYENPPMHLNGTIVEPIPNAKANLFSTYLKIQSCLFVANTTSASKGNGIGGAIVIDDSTGAIIADSTFLMNSAKNKGGAVLLTSEGTKSPFLGYMPYTNFVGNVVFVANTFESNEVDMAGGGGADSALGYGAAVRVEGFTNAVQFVNCTFSDGWHCHSFGWQWRDCHTGSACRIRKNVFGPCVILFVRADLTIHRQ